MARVSTRLQGPVHRKQKHWWHQAPWQWGVTPNKGVLQGAWCSSQAPLAPVEGELKAAQAQAQLRCWGPGQEGRGTWGRAGPLAAEAQLNPTEEDELSLLK